MDSGLLKIASRDCVLPRQGKNLLLNDSRRLDAWNVIGTCSVHRVECELQLAAHSMLNRCGSCELNAIKHGVRQVRWCSRPRPNQSNPANW
jgi:hypothetical protein